MKEIQSELINYLMAEVSGAAFEEFTKRLFAIEFKHNFKPLGGIHDGGADGLLLNGIHECVEEANTFCQFSTTGDSGAQSKIVQTIAALQNAGRNPVQVIYATSERLPKQDVVVSYIFKTYMVLAVIRDLEWIHRLINSNNAANTAFYETFAGRINSLARSTVPLQGKVNEYVTDPAVFAHLNHQLSDRFSKEKLYIPIVDALIFSVLRDTDPDSTPLKLMTRTEVAAAIGAVFPNARSVLIPHLDDRLKELTKKAGGIERLRFYRKQDAFCLPFEMREELVANALTEVNSQAKFKQSITNRLGEISKAAQKNLSVNAIQLCTSLVFDSVHSYFVEQGVVLSAFLKQRLEHLQISDQVLEDELRLAVSGTAGLKRGDVTPESLAFCMRTLRGLFYEPTRDESNYLEYLSRTAMLFSTLQSSPKVIDYFNSMAGNYRLLVGTDILIKALTEIYLEPSQRQVTNLLTMAAAMGATLILSDPVLEEMLSHLHGVDLEFHNHYYEREPYLTSETIAHCDRILIRAYFYAKSLPKGPKNWRHFIDSILDPDALTG